MPPFVPTDSICQGGPGRVHKWISCVLGCLCVCTYASVSVCERAWVRMCACEHPCAQEQVCLQAAGIILSHVAEHPPILFHFPVRSLHGNWVENELQPAELDPFSSGPLSEFVFLVDITCILVTM